MQKFKDKWEIKHNWQLIFPLLGIIALLFSAYKLANLFTSNYNVMVTLVASALVFYILLKSCLFIFKKLEGRWVVEHKWEIIAIFIVFAVTGSTAAKLAAPITEFIGIGKETTNPWMYWIIRIFLIFVVYQILLVAFGWLFGQHKFFWAFEKKMLARFGFKNFK